MTFDSFVSSLDFSPGILNLLGIALTIVLGLTLGRLQLGQISIGVAGVLFAGIFLSQIGLKVSPEVLEFVRDFGLIIFVFTIGVQVGPRFFDNLRQNGLKLNLLAVSIILLGIALAFAAYHFGGFPTGSTVGVLAGAVTNTASLGAAQEILHSNVAAVNLSTIAYAVAYPMGIMGNIFAMIILKSLKKIDIARERQTYEEENSSPIIAVNILIENKDLAGREIGKIRDFSRSPIIFSRILHGKQVALVHTHTILHTGDVIRAIGPKKNIDRLCAFLGSESSTRLENIPSDFAVRRMVITNRKAVGKTIQELKLRQSFRVTATRISHDNFELPATNQTILYYGDSIVVIGELEDIEKFAKFIGDSPEALNHPFILPVFVGMFLGILVGQIPIQVPGLPAPVKIGLAGGPLVVSILASRLGRFGNVIWYMPVHTNLLMRKFGICLFLACVGLKSGASFIQTVLTFQGLTWFLWGTAITMAPLILVGAYALFKMKLNYLTVCGLMAGSVTGPTALLFATGLARSNAQTVAYSTVYPVVIILRVVSIQILTAALSAG